MEANQGPAAVDAATEVKAMGQVAEALDSLDVEARHRVLDWASGRYGSGRARDRSERREKKEERGAVPDMTDAEEYADLAALYNAAGPTTDDEKVLVAGYWHQVHEKKQNLDGQALNKDLRDLGHRVGNVTRACSMLIKTKPQLMIQVGKSGSTQQARKQYRLTEAGLRKVRKMLTSSDEDADEA